MEPLIEVRGVTKKFGKTTILNNISFTVNKNEIFGLIGQSGSGKTVMLKLLIGFYTPDSGDILYEGRSILKHRKELMPIIGFASQKHSIYYDLNVMENLRYFGRLYGMKEKEIAENSKRVLELVELAGCETKSAGKMSGGMQRRLDIACSMLHSPKILIMDEPESGLDPVLRKHIANLIKKIKKEGTTVLLSSHFMNEIEPFCDRVAMLKKGVLAAYGSPIEILKNYSDKYEIVLRSSPGNYNAVLASLQRGKMAMLGSRIEDRKLKIYVPMNRQPEDYLKYVITTTDALKETVVDVQLNHPSLEDVFERLIV